MRIVYIAHPYTGEDVVGNVRAAIAAAEELVKDNTGLIPFVPHLNLLWDFMHPHDKEFWYAYDLNIMTRCDFVLRIGGNSVGADKEVGFAEKLRMPIFYTVPQLLDFWRKEGGVKGEDKHVGVVGKPVGGQENAG